MENTDHARSLISRDYGLLWAARVVSTTGDFVFASALIVWIGLVVGRGQTWAPEAVGGALVATSLPLVLFGPIAGVLADRGDRRRVMLGADMARFGLLVPTALVLGTPMPTVWRLGVAYGVVAGLSVLDQLFRSASTGLIGTLVPAERREGALGSLQAATSLAMIVGPAVGVPLALRFGMPWATLLDALSFALSFALVRVLSARGSHAVTQAVGVRGIMAELVVGLGVLVGNRTLRSLAAALAIAMLGGSALNALDLFFVTHNLHTPASWYGLLDAVFGVGIVAGAILCAAWGHRVGARRLVPLALFSLGLAVIVYARLESFAPAVVLIFVCGIPMAVLQVSAGALILEATPSAMVGRISALLEPLTIAASLAGAALAGYLDSSVLRGLDGHVLGIALGPIDTIFTAAGVLVLAGATYALIGLRPAEAGDRTIAVIEKVREDSVRHAGVQG